MGEPAVKPLIASLQKFEGRNLMQPLGLLKNSEGVLEPVGDIFERRWGIGAYTVQDEAFALGCLGSPAVDS